MKLQLLSDLHLETETFDPEPAPGAELLVLAGDIDATWAGYSRFKNWPVPVLVVAGNHEFDGRELSTAWPAFARHCDTLGLRLLQRETLVFTAASGRRVRVVGTTRWSDFDLFGAAQRPRAQRAAGYFMRLMAATCRGQPLTLRACASKAWPAAPGWRPRCKRRHKAAGTPRWSSRISPPACSAPTRATAASPARPASATLTTT